MKLAPKVVRNYKQRLSTMTIEKLQIMLQAQKTELSKLKESYSAEDFNYLSYSINQKITLIEQELNRRNISFEHQISHTI